jgi:hypothetical protein
MIKVLTNSLVASHSRFFCYCPQYVSAAYSVGSTLPLQFGRISRPPSVIEVAAVAMGLGCKTYL